MFDPRRPANYSQKKVSSDSIGLGTNANVPNQLRYLGMEWIMIEDEDKKERFTSYKTSPRSNGVSSVKHASEKKFNFYASPTPLGSISKRSKISATETDASIYEEDLINEAKRLMKSGRSLNEQVGTKSAALLPHDNDSSLPIKDENGLLMHHNNYHHLVKTLGNVSMTSTDGAEKQDSQRNHTVKTLVKMYESNAEYEDLFLSKGKKPPVTMKTKAETPRDVEEQGVNAMRKGEIGFKSNPRMYFVSPTGVVSTSALHTKTDPDSIIESEIKKESAEEKRAKLVGPSRNFALVFETGTAGHAPVHSHNLGPEKLLSDHLDYELFIKSEKEKRKERTGDHELKNLLEKFASKPGKKMYESPFVTYDKVRVEVQALSKTKHWTLGKDSKSGLPHLSSPKKHISDDTEAEGEMMAEMREKALADLLFERFKTKLPEIHQNKLTLKENKGQFIKKPIDNAVNRRKNYDAWYVSPKMRAERLSSFIQSASKH